MNATEKQKVATVQTEVDQEISRLRTSKEVALEKVSFTCCSWHNYGNNASAVVTIVIPSYED